MAAQTLISRAAWNGRRGRRGARRNENDKGNLVLPNLTRGIRKLVILSVTSPPFALQPVSRVPSGDYPSLLFISSSVSKNNWVSSGMQRLHPYRGGVNRDVKQGVPALRQPSPHRAIPKVRTFSWFCLIPIWFAGSSSMSQKYLNV